MIARAVTDLPEPLSPTKGDGLALVQPVKDTSRTASIMPPSTLNDTPIFLASIAMFMGSFLRPQ